MLTKITARCSWPGCESEAPLNPADLENGPKAADLEPTLCVYHDDEERLMACIRFDLERSGDLPAEELAWS